VAATVSSKPNWKPETANPVQNIPCIIQIEFHLKSTSLTTQPTTIHITLLILLSINLLHHI